jgi:acetyl esterase/lipase
MAIVFLISLFLSLVGLFLSLWIVVPAPTLLLLPLGVGAPEVSPWLIVVNAIAFLLALLRVQETWISSIALICSIAGLILSSSPLIQLPNANTKFANEVRAVLGADYLEKISPDLQTKMRAHPFVLMDVFRSIPTREVRVSKGIAFANPDGVTLKLNVYRPLQVGRHPTIIAVYGGAWRTGSPNNDETFNRYMAAQGYTVVSVDYRHAPQYRYPAQIEDVRSAIAYIQQHADQFEIDNNRMALMGRSAGSHLAMLAAYQSSTFPIRAVVNYYGPVDLTIGYNDPPFPDPINTRFVLRQFLGGTPEELPDLYHQASPFTYATRSLPPTLLVYGDRDHLVQSKFGQALYNRLRQADNSAILLRVPWAEHAFDAVFNGVSNQLALYYTERFLAWTLREHFD